MRKAVREGLLACTIGAASIVGGGAALSGVTEAVISQRNKQFLPDRVSVEAGQPVVIVNDDGETVHHAYVESEHFNFDSGDQTPGTRTRIVFPAKGDFQVLCGIHPKMKLAVHVH